MGILTIFALDFFYAFFFLVLALGLLGVLLLLYDLKLKYQRR